MPRRRSVRRRSRSTRRWWAVAAIAVSLSVVAGVVIVAKGNSATPAPTLQTSAFTRPGWGRGGYVQVPRSSQGAGLSGSAAQVSTQTRQQPSVQRETSKQFLAAFKRQQAKEYKAYLRDKRRYEEEFQRLLKEWKSERGRHHVTPPPTVTPPPVITPTATPTASPTATATPTASATTAPATMPTATTAPATTPTATTPATTPTATATATPTATATATPTATATATATPTATATTATATPTATTTTTTPVGAQATSQTWAGYAATGAAGTFTSVAANWMVPPVACNGASTRSSYAAGLDGDGTNATEQIGTEGDCAGDFGVYSGWYQVAPNAPVFFTNPVKPGDMMTASVTSLGGGTFMLTLFDMTQNWTQVTQQTSAAATLGSAEIVAEDPVQNGQAQPLANFGIVDFLGGAINNAAITAPINELTLQSAAGNTLAVPSTITGGVGNFSVGWDASA